MEKDLARRHFEDSPGGFTLHGKPPAELRIGEQSRSPVDAQRIWVAGYQKEQPQLGVRDEVMEAVDTVVPGSIRDKKGMGILNGDEARSIAARGGIGPAARIGRRNDEEWRSPNEGPSVHVNMVEALFHRQDARSAIEARQFGDSFNLSHLLAIPTP